MGGGKTILRGKRTIECALLEASKSGIGLVCDGVNIDRDRKKGSLRKGSFRWRNL